MARLHPIGIALIASVVGGSCTRTTTGPLIGARCTASNQDVVRRSDGGVLEVCRDSQWVPLSDGSVAGTNDAAAAPDSRADTSVADVLPSPDARPCAPGEPAPGGLYVSCGPNPLIMMPPGCVADSTEPTCAGEDSVKLPWGSYVWRGADSPEDGALNSVNLGVFAAASPGAHPAAEYCLGLTLGGFDDWYLPAGLEFQLALINRAALSLVTNSSYWSSSELDVDAATITSAGASFGGSKKGAALVRCVRRQGLPLPAPTVAIPNAGTGYFVLSAGMFDGQLGGMAGSNQKCLQDLLANEWKGKDEAIRRALLDADHVRSFLCADADYCQSPLPHVRYHFARSGRLQAGGASFTADAQGRGPGNNVSWTGTNYFDGAATYWTARRANTVQLWSLGGSGTSNGSYCLDWALGGEAMTGASDGLGSARWSRSGSNCADQLRLICMVDP